MVGPILQLADIELSGTVLTGVRGRIDLDVGLAGVLRVLLATPGQLVSLEVLAAAFEESAGLVEAAMPKILKQMRQVLPMLSRRGVRLRTSPDGAAVAITTRRAGPFKAET